MRHAHASMNTKVRHKTRYTRSQPKPTGFSYTTITENGVPVRVLLLNGQPCLKQGFKCGREEMLTLVRNMNRASKPMWDHVLSRWIAAREKGQALEDD